MIVLPCYIKTDRTGVVLLNNRQTAKCQRGEKMQTGSRCGWGLNFLLYKTVLVSVVHIMAFFLFFLAHSLAVAFNNYPVITLQEMQDVCMLSIIKKGILTRHVMMCYVTLNHDTNL